MGQKFILQICRHFSPFHPIEHLFSSHKDGKSESTYELKMVLDSHSILYILSEASNLEGERESHIERNVSTLREADIVAHGSQLGDRRQTRI